MFPEGVMWLDGSLYVGAPPSIWKLTDTDGDGVADRREEWFKGSLGGCANDIHGPYAGPDGWVYWCKGGFEQQTYPRPGKKPLVSRAAHILRCRPDGTGLEPVMTGGMDNPVGLIWTPGGEMIFTTTFLQHPAGGKRDGLIHAVYGGVYGKDHGVLDGHVRTSPHLMPVMTHLGAAAPCGLVHYESTAFGKEYKDNLFACLFNMHKVTRHVLVPDGATFKTIDSDFLVSDNLDFHPTDVKEDADGSLLVIDTGGWYKLCCPTSQLHKPDVLGAIYRIRKTGASKVDDPRGRKVNWAAPTTESLVKLLDDARPTVRRCAVAALARRGSDAVPELARIIGHGRSVEAQRNAVWAATRIDSPAAREAVAEALRGGEETVRQAALHSIGLRRDDRAGPLLVLFLSPVYIPKWSAQNRRAAAEALSRIGDKSDVPILLSALAEQNDRVLDHSLTYALIAIGDREGTAAGLKDGSPRVRRAALIALDQMEGGKLSPGAVAAELTSPDGALKETASWVARRHPEWGQALAGYLRDRLAVKEQSAGNRDELTNELARFARTPAVQELLAEQLRGGSIPPERTILALHAMARSGLKEAPVAWVAALEQVLVGRDVELIREAVATARAVPVKGGADKLAAALLRVGDDDKLPQPVRLGALAAVPGGLPSVKSATFDWLLTRLDREQPVADRGFTADVLAKAKLTSGQLVALTAAFKTIAPTDADRLLEAFAQSSDDHVGEVLLAALKRSPARSSLRPEFIRPRLAKFGPGVQKEAESLYALLNANLAAQRARLDELLAGLKDGEVRRGQAVFNSPKAACISCHAVGYLGGTIGPDLTHVGKIRSERDLLESIVFPSASFVRSYEPVEITTKKGKVYNGVVRRETPDEVVLAINATEEVRVARQDIDEVQPGKVSIMPAGLDQQLTRQELADLVAFLKACK
jgi:putative membrane-bound dehydrogenase-like protein